jgi:molecular chaperone GrpE
VSSKKDHADKKIKVESGEPVETSQDPVDTIDPEKLKAALTAKEKEAKENYDRYLRAVAELENFKKRAARDKADIIKYGKEDLIKDILPFLDSLDRALSHAESAESGDVQSFKSGIALIQDQLLCCLKKHGVEKIDSVGENFDPNVHEALMQMNSAEHRDNQIVSEMEKGYLLNGRLIRPSRVCVCKKNKDNDGCEIKETNG